jgi:hypothetical protein
MLVIARLNWPFYLAAIGFIIFGTVGLFLDLNGLLRTICGLGVFGATYFVVSSLGVAHWVYDRAGIYSFAWLENPVGELKGKKVILAHAGFDESSVLLREMYVQTSWRVIDHFDAKTMTEESVRRARKLYPPSEGTLPGPYNHWPATSSEFDMVLALFAIHEFRNVEERRAWFVEAQRCLVEGGQVIILEHLRDWVNLLAFGPGFMHFHSLQSWKASWGGTGFTLKSEAKLTPWVSVFRLVKV